MLVAARPAGSPETLIAENIDFVGTASSRERGFIKQGADQPLILSGSNAVSVDR
jgi:hypothetical protein